MGKCLMKLLYKLLLMFIAFCSLGMLAVMNLILDFVEPIAKKTVKLIKKEDSKR